MEHFRSAEVDNKGLALITEHKNATQLELIVEMLGPDPSEEEIFAWIKNYGGYVNEYFYKHPKATKEDREDILKFIVERKKQELH